MRLIIRHLTLILTLSTAVSYAQSPNNEVNLPDFSTFSVNSAQETRHWSTIFTRITRYDTRFK